MWWFFFAIVALSLAPVAIAEATRALAPTLSILVLVAGMAGIACAVGSWLGRRRHHRQYRQRGPWDHL